MRALGGECVYAVKSGVSICACSVCLQCVYVCVRVCMCMCVCDNVIVCVYIYVSVIGVCERERENTVYLHCVCVSISLPVVYLYACVDVSGADTIISMLFSVHLSLLCMWSMKPSVSVGVCEDEGESLAF